MLSFETVEKIALTVLNREAYIIQKCQKYSWKTYQDATSSDRADISRETTPCPGPLMNSSSTVAGGYTPSGVGGRSGDEKSNDETSPAETRRHDNGNDGDKDLFPEESDKCDDDDADQTDSDESEESGIVTENYIDPFRQQIHQTAKEKGFKYHFHKQLTSSRKVTSLLLPSRRFLSNRTNRVEIFHGCGIDFSLNPLASAQRLYMTLSSFLEYGPAILDMTGIQKRSYLSTEAAIYYSNSHGYARLWPIIKTGLSRYRELDIIPQERSLIAVGRIPPRIITGKENNLLVARIPQNNPALASRVSCPSWNNLLISTQYANRNTSPTAKVRKAITKTDPSSRFADIILSPLPQFDQNNLRNCYIGTQLQSNTAIADVTFVAGCTIRGAKALSTHVTEYVIYGYGNGRLGRDADENDWGTAFCIDS